MHLVGSRQKKLEDFCKRMAVTIFQNYMMKVEKELGVFNLGGKKKAFQLLEWSLLEEKIHLLWMTQATQKI